MSFGLDRFGDFLLLRIDLVSDLGDVRITSQVGAQFSDDAVDLGYPFVEASGEANLADPIAEVPFELPVDGRHRERTERNASGRIKSVDRHYQGEARDLKEVLKWLRTPAKG